MRTPLMQSRELRRLRATTTTSSPPLSARPRIIPPTPHGQPHRRAAGVRYTSAKQPQRRNPRKTLDLYAQVRPCKHYPGVRTRYADAGIDIVIVRENTEDLYAGIEFERGSEGEREVGQTIERVSGTKIREVSGISIKPISEAGTRRVVQFAFDYARGNGRRRVTSVHKANIMKHTDGLWLDVSRQVAAENSDIEFDDRIVDNMCMQLVQKPELYDVLVLPNLYGDIVSDLGAGLVGGLGVAPGGNFGTAGAVFEPTHGSAPKYTGQNKVNPIAMMLSGVMMLRHLEESDAADRLEAAVA